MYILEREYVMINLEFWLSIYSELEFVCSVEHIPRPHRHIQLKIPRKRNICSRKSSSKSQGSVKFVNKALFTLPISSIKTEVDFFFLLLQSVCYFTFGKILIFLSGNPGRRKHVNAESSLKPIWRF